MSKSNLQNTGSDHTSETATIEVPGQTLSAEAVNREILKRIAKPEQQQIEQSAEQRAKHIWEDPIEEEGVDPRQDQINLQKDNAKEAGEPVEEREKIKEEQRKAKREIKQKQADDALEAADRAKMGLPEAAKPDDQKPYEQRQEEERQKKIRERYEQEQKALEKQQQQVMKEESKQATKEESNKPAAKTI